MNLTREEQKRIFQTIEKYPDQDYYVYALCDKNVPFYIGKGKAERVLQHLKEADNRSVEEAMQMADDESNDIKNPQKNSEKIERIRAAGENLQHVIIKWGLTEHEAFMCESALINLLEFSKDAVIEKLTNAVDGHASDAEKTSLAEDKTKARTLEQFLRECAIESKDIKEIPVPVAFIKINTLYEKCRDKDPQKELEQIKDTASAMWEISDQRRPYIQYVFATYQQRVVGIFNVERISGPVADEWKANGLRDFPTFPEDTRQMDRWKAQFSSFAEAEKALTHAEYEIFKAQIEKECRDSKAKKKPTPEERLKHERSKVFFVLGNNIPAEIMAFYNCRLHDADSEAYFTGTNPVLSNLKYFDFKTLSKKEKNKKNESAKDSQSGTTAKKIGAVIRNAGSENWKSLTKKSVFSGKHWSVADNGKSIYSYLPGNRYLTFKILKSSENSAKIEFGILSEYKEEYEKSQNIIKAGQLKKQLAAFIEGNILRYGGDSFVIGFDREDTYFVLKPIKTGRNNKSVNIEDIESEVSAFEKRLINCGLNAELLELCK